jgi:excisionase family DNA binding protein
MARVTSPQAAEILSTTQPTINRWVNEGLLPAERRTLRRLILIDIDDLRRFAQNNGYSFDERLASQYAE